MPACTGAKREKCRNGARAAGNGSFAFSQRGPFVYTPPGAGLCRSPAASSRRMYGADTCPPAGERNRRGVETGDGGGERLLRVFSQRPICPHAAGRRTASRPRSTFAADARRRYMPACTGSKKEKRRNGAMAAGNGSFAFSQRGPFAHMPPGAGLRAARSVFAADVWRRHMPACTGAKRVKRRNRRWRRETAPSRILTEARLSTRRWVQDCVRPAASSRRMYGAGTCPPAREQSGRSDETGRWRRGKSTSASGAFIPNAAGCGGASKRWENAQPQNEFCEKGRTRPTLGS